MSDSKTMTYGVSIVSKIQRLEVLKETIMQHQVLLDLLLAERDKLEQEIAISAAGKPIIHRLPMEVLTEIFAEVTFLDPYASYDLPTANRDRVALMLVCKIWNTTVNETPVLWSTIHFKLPSYHTDFFLWAARMNAYLDQCLSKSGQTALELVINLDSAYTGHFSAYKRIQSALKSPSCPSGTSDWLLEGGWVGCPTAQGYEEMLKDLIGRVIGVQGETKKRWRTLFLHLPEIEDAFENVWPMFNQPAPHLTFLDLNGWGKIHTPSVNSAFALPSLETLELCGMSMKTIPFCSRLRRIQFWIDISEQDWTELSMLTQFPLLEEIVLEVIQDESTPEQFDSPIVPTIRIPFLKRLEIRGRLPPRVIQALQITKLSNLKLGDTGSGILPFPSAHLFSAAQHLCTDLWDYKGRDWNLLLSSLFSQLSSVHTIEFVSEIFDMVSELVRKLKHEGCLQSLTRLVVYDGQGEVKDELNFIDSSPGLSV